MKSLANEVLRVGTSALGLKEKRRFEARRLVQLGGKAKKPDFIPVNILVGQRKKAHQRVGRRRRGRCCCRRRRRAPLTIADPHAAPLAGKAGE